MHPLACDSTLSMVRYYAQVELGTKGYHMTNTTKPERHAFHSHGMRQSLENTPLGRIIQSISTRDSTNQKELITECETLTTIIAGGTRVLSDWIARESEDATGIAPMYDATDTLMLLASISDLISDYRSWLNYENPDA